MEADKRKRRNPEEGRLTQPTKDSSEEPSPSTSLKNERLEKLQEIENKRSRLFREQSDELVDEILGAIGRAEGETSNERKRGRDRDSVVPSPRSGSPVFSMIQGREKRKRLFVETDACGFEVDMAGNRVQSSLTPVYLGRIPQGHTIDTNMTAGYGEAPGSESQDVYYSKKFPLSSYEPLPDHMNIDEIDLESSEEDNGPVVDPPKPKKEYCDFVLKLMQKRPGMSEIINTVKRRPTAVDMWKEDDKRRLERELLAA